MQKLQFCSLRAEPTSLSPRPEDQSRQKKSAKPFRNEVFYNLFYRSANIFDDRAFGHLNPLYAFWFVLSPYSQNIAHLARNLITHQVLLVEATDKLNHLVVRRGSSFSSGRVHIETKSFGVIDQVINLEIKGRLYPIRVVGKQIVVNKLGMMISGSPRIEITRFPSPNIILWCNVEGTTPASWSHGLPMMRAACKCICKERDNQSQNLKRGFRRRAFVMGFLRKMGSRRSLSWMRAFHLLVLALMEKIRS